MHSQTCMLHHDHHLHAFWQGPMTQLDACKINNMRPDQSRFVPKQTDPKLTCVLVHSR